MTVFEILAWVVIGSIVWPIPVLAGIAIYAGVAAIIEKIWGLK